MTTPAEKKVIELAREVIANFSDNGECMEFKCPICNGDKEYNAMLVRDINTPEEDENREARVFCDCHEGQVEMLVEYEYLAADTSLRDLELAIVSLDIEGDIERSVKPELRRVAWAGEFGDAHHKSFEADHGESPPFTPEQLSELAARGYARTSQSPPEGVLVPPEASAELPTPKDTWIDKMPELPVTMFAQPTISSAALKRIAGYLDPPSSDRPVRRRRRQK
jgi:hypothetical protein